MCNSKNIFITTGAEFNAYCNFLFQLLDRVKEDIGDNNEDRYSKRYCAFFGERMLSVFLRGNAQKYYEADCKYKNDVILKCGSFVSKKLKIIKKTSMYNYLKKNTGASSSYRSD